MAAAALPAIAAELEVAKLSGQAAHEFLAWARQPFYSNIRTTTRSWTEIDKKGKAHALVETKTKGFAISNGTVLGILLTFMVWETALSFAKAIQGWFGNSSNAASNPVLLAAEVLAAPIFIYYDAANAVVGFAKGVAGQAGQFFDWLDGKGPSKTSPPPTAVRSAPMPTTAMAAISQLFIGVTAPAGQMADMLARKVSNAISNTGQ